MTILKNIVTDFGAIGNGIADDGPKFSDFNIWAIANQGSDQIILTVPAGTYLFATGNDQRWTDGVKDLIVSGYGATLTNNGSATPGFFLGGRGVLNDATHNAAIATVAAVA